ncbi:hypothetical protein AB0J80_02225 [Actinoplanes sp. NPDC049548]|uniref:hypothetical protein n=1 Tax=Actinoplanes sp. NPDC049548 TaxID=3155152 RepID=UPI003413944C
MTSLLAGLREHVHEAKLASTAYLRRRAELKALHAGDPAGYPVAKKHDFTLQDHAGILAKHQQMVAMYANALAGEAAAAKLLADRRASATENTHRTSNTAMPQNPAHRMQRERSRL